MPRTRNESSRIAAAAGSKIHGVARGPISGAPPCPAATRSPSPPPSRRLPRDQRQREHRPAPRDARFDRLRRVRARLAPLLVGAALGLAGAAQGDDPPAADPAAGGSPPPSVHTVVHPRPYLRRRAEWLSDELRTPDGPGKPWLDWEEATGDWGGVRPQIQEHGVILGVGYAGELFSNAHGGATTRDATHAAGLATLSLSLDTTRLGLWQGGTLVASGEHLDGRGVSQE